MAVLRTLVRSVTQRAPAIPQGQDGRVDILALLGFSRAMQMEITPEKALMVSALWRGFKIRASLAAALPLHVYQDSATGGRKQIKLPSEAYIWQKPNPEVNKFVFWSTVFLHLVMNGNAFLYVVATTDPLTGKRRPVELWPIEPHRVKVTRDRESGWKTYLIDGTTPAGDWVRGGARDVIVHVQGLGTDGLKGLSPIQLFARNIGITLAADSYAESFFGNSSAPGGYLSTDQIVTPEQAQALSEYWEEQHRGADNAHRLAVLGKGTTWNTTRLNPEDSQLLMTRQFQVSDASRITEMPEHLLGSHDKQSSWGTGIAEQNRGILVYTVDADLVNVEMTISEELLAPQNHYAKFSREALLRGTPKEQAEYFEKMFGLGVFSTNNILELQDLDGIGPEGDKRFRPANYVPLGFVPSSGAPPAPVEAKPAAGVPA